MLTVSSCINSNRLKSELNKEKNMRFDLEKVREEFKKEKATIDEKINNLNQALDEEKAAHQATKKALLQEQLVGQSLKEELQKVTKLKEALEEDLKEALVEGRVKSKSK